MPEHDLPVLDAEERACALAWTVAAGAPAVPEQERRADDGSLDLEREDPARARQALVPRSRLLERAQPAYVRALDHLCALCEQARGGRVVL